VKRISLAGNHYYAAKQDEDRQREEETGNKSRPWKVAAEKGIWNVPTALTLYPAGSWLLVHSENILHFLVGAALKLVAANDRLPHGQLNLTEWPVEEL
jgi:hypothetical protein